MDLNKKIPLWVQLRYDSQDHFLWAINNDWDLRIKRYEIFKTFYYAKIDTTGD